MLYKSKCVQGSYGAPTKKPTSLYSNHTKFVLCNKLSTEDQARIRWTNKQLVTRKRLADGRLRVAGIPSTLRSTQAYTPEFGQAIVRAWQTPCVPLLHGRNMFDLYIVKCPFKKRLDGCILELLRIPVVVLIALPVHLSL